MAACDKYNQDPNVRASSYEALSALVTSSAKDCFPTIHNLATHILDRLEQTIAMQGQIVGSDERRMVIHCLIFFKHVELQANLCGVMTVTKDFDY